MASLCNAAVQTTAESAHRRSVERRRIPGISITAPAVSAPQNAAFAAEARHGSLDADRPGPWDQRASKTLMALPTAKPYMEEVPMSAGDWKRFYQAVCDGDMRLVRHYIEAGIDVNYAHPEFFSTPLVAAIRNQREEVALFILQRGADPLRVSEVDGASPWICWPPATFRAFKSNWTAWGLPPGLHGISGNAGWAGSGSAGPHRPPGGSTQGQDANQTHPQHLEESACSAKTHSLFFTGTHVLP